ncbi:threonine-phosphate decarboxylase CobD [Cognatishimia sp. WU-CL00825]|uniref:threonine-phosphate decarboxylase CobD n=1 Tax=Cognatishimia sp. WU-CL00825 TaxID=3127658 RepID=UPI003103DAFB
MSNARDHGGGLDAAILTYGGSRETWLDLSTGINPQPYPLPEFTANDWGALPDSQAQADLTAAARSFWNVPASAAILAAPGASSLIARLPNILPGHHVDIPKPTYNEHAAAYHAHGWAERQTNADLRVLVHPNNPTGQFWSTSDLATTFNVVDESFCDIAPEASMIAQTAQPNCLILKSFGKFWGLAGLRLGFVIGNPELLAKLQDSIGPWAVSGPALRTATAALGDHDWAAKTRARLAQDSQHLDALMTQQGAKVAGGCDLFRLYQVDNAQTWQARLAKHHVWSRIFPYSDTYLRLGLPAHDRWDHLTKALNG